ESLVISVLGGLAGLAFGWLVVTGLGQAGFIRQYFPLFFIPEHDLIIGAVLALALGFVAGGFPGVDAVCLRLVGAVPRGGRTTKCPAAWAGMGPGSSRTLLAWRGKMAPLWRLPNCS